MPAHLTSLPQEIRDVIQGLCLIVDAPINPYPASYEDKNPFAATNREPDVALLLVCKSINAEATEVLYSGNVWKVTWRAEDGLMAFDVPRYHQLDYEGEEKPLNKIWVKHRTRIHHVTLDFDVQDLDGKTLLRTTKLQYEKFGTVDPVAVDRLIHIDRMMVHSEICRWKIKVVFNIQVRSACIDVQNLFCPGGCCRSEVIGISILGRLLVLWAFYLRESQSREDEVPKLTVIGFRNEAEMTAVKQEWEETHGRQLKDVVDMDGGLIGLRGFLERRGGK